MKCTSSAKSRTDTNIQLIIKFQATFPWEDFSPTFAWLLVKSLTFPLTAVKFL